MLQARADPLLFPNLPQNVPFSLYSATRVLYNHKYQTLPNYLLLDYQYPLNWMSHASHAHLHY